MARKHLQQSFAGGEVSPSMYGRLDDQKYQQGLATCRNFICLPQGPVQNRAGFAFVGEVKYSARKTVLIPFVFSSADTAVLEFGHKYIRVITNGGYISSASGSSTPYEIETPYEENDLSDLHWAQSGDVLTIVHPSYQPREIRRYGTRDWRVVGVSFAAPLSTPTGLSGSYYCGDPDAKDAEKTAYTIKYRVTAVKTTDEGDKESAASATCAVTANVYLSSSRVTLTWSAVDGAERYRVYKTYSGVYGYIGETEDLSFVDNNLAANTDKTPPRYDDPFSQTGGIASVTITNAGSGYGVSNQPGSLSGLSYTITVDSDTRSRISAEVYDADGYGSGATATVVAAYRVSERDTSKKFSRTRRYIDITAVNVSGGTGYINPKVKILVPGYKKYTSAIAKAAASTASSSSASTAVYTVDSSNNAVFDLALPVNNKLTATVTDSNGSGAEIVFSSSGGGVTGYTIRNAGSGYLNPKITITGAGSGATATCSTGKTGDFPGAVSYFEQRRIFAGTKQRPQFVWMTRPGTESDMSYTLPSQSDNRIKFRVAALQASQIRHVVPLSSLILLTTGAEFRVTTANDDTLTPSSIGVKPQSYIGANNVQPIAVNSSIVYAAERGGHLWELGYNWQASGFVTGDMCLRAAHFFDGLEIVSLALAKAPHPTIWAVSSDGSLYGCTYVPEQSIGAWHRHETADGFFESVACIAEGDEDILYAVVRRFINGKYVRYIERMHERQVFEVENGFFVDCGVEDRYATAQNYVEGLSHIEGKTVSILADGKVMPQAVVTDGKVTFPDKAQHVIVGIPITSDIKTLPMALQTNDGGYGQGSRKSITKVFVRVVSSSGLAAGQDEDSLYRAASRYFDPYGKAPALRTEDIEVKLGPGWQDEGTVFIRQDEPLPITICGITAEVAM